MTRTTSLSALLAAVSLSEITLLGGCAAEIYDDGSVVEVEAEPPPPQVEVVPPVPYTGAVWVGGRWMWRGHSHVWVPGRYVRPRRGYVYAPHAWVRNGSRWRYTPGRWHRR